MKRWLEGVAIRRAARSGPVTDPLRVLVVDAEPVSGAALARAIDMDRDMAVVGQSRDLRRVGTDAARCGPDLVAVRLSIEDERCREVLAALAGVQSKPCVVVLGGPGAPENATRDAARLVTRIRAVAEAAVDRNGDMASPVIVPMDLPPPSSRLH
ncbi:MAG: hypothetical protein AB7O56_08120 [Bauldia sp.]